jgi:hypothetical protein
MEEEDDDTEESLCGEVCTLPAVGLKNIVGWFR